MKVLKDNNIPLSPEVEVKAEEISVPHHVCGGSIISTKFIFTAAHCFDPFGLSEYIGDQADDLPADIRTYSFTKENFLVVVGAHELPSNNKITSMEQVENDKNIVRIREIINHKKYTRVQSPETPQYDFSIVRLESSLMFSAKVAPVCLPEPGAANPKYAGQKGVISGWGKTDIYDIKTSPVLKHLKVNIFSNEDCLKIYQDFIERKALLNGTTESEAKEARSQAFVHRYHVSIL